MATGATSSATQEVEALKKDIADLRKQVSEQASKIAKDGNNIAHLSVDELQGMARRAGKEVRSFMSDKQKQLMHAKDECEESIKMHPFVYTAAAFASGMLLAALLRRR